MKKLSLIISCVPYCAIAPDTITIHQQRYTKTYDHDKHYTVLVHRLITKVGVDGSPRLMGGKIFGRIRISAMQPKFNIIMILLRLLINVGMT